MYIENKILTILCVVVTIIYLVFIVFLIIAFRNMIIDHKCYVMDDDTFYSSEMCKNYWEDRKNGK